MQIFSVNFSWVKKGFVSSSALGNAEGLELWWMNPATSHLWWAAQASESRAP